VAPLLWLGAAALAFLAVGGVLELRAGPVRGDTIGLGSPALPEASRRRQRTAGGALARSVMLFASSASLYLLIAAYLVLHRGSVVGDAEARVAQAWYVVGSRDPHLGAIGFVWNPLPSLAAIPLVMLRGVWPALTDRAFAGSIVSALCMAGAVVQFRAALRQIGTVGPIAVVLTACFALNPMILYYGANGMSEAMYLLFLVGTTRYLLEWTTSGRARALVLAGVNLSLAYLTRYEALAAAMLVGAVVLIVGTVARDHARPRRARLTAAGTDLVVVLFPVVLAFVGWTIVSWVITGQPFAQFTSQYGNASILRASGGSAGANGTGLPKIALAALQVSSYAPLLVVLLGVVAYLAVRRGDRRFLALGALAGPLIFSLLAYVDGQTFGFLRYYIPVLPLYLLAAALALSPLPGMRPVTPPWLTRDPLLAVGAALVIGLPGMVSCALAMGSTELAPAEQAALAWVFRPAHSAAERQWQAELPSTERIAAAIDHLGLPDGSVAVDTFNCGSLIVLASHRPHQFVITSDRDFERIVADPVPFHVPYLLVPSAYAGIDAIDRAHPGIFDGGQVGSLQTTVAAQYDSTSCSTYHLIRVSGDGS
jgi:hypothetical protein